MSDRDDNAVDPNDDAENFAELLESYSDGMNEDIRVGEKIHGKIISIGMDSVYIDTGTKLDGVVEKTEFLDDNGDVSVAVGDTIDLYVVSQDESEIRLSKALSGADSGHMLLDAFKNKIPVDGKVTAECKGGFHITVMGKRAFCPVSHIDLRYVEKPDQYVGETYPFLIVRYEERGRNIVVSRRDYLNRELAEDRKVFLNDLAVDKQVEGTVTKLMPYGAFIELFPGIEGMAHISELSWSRLESPQEAVTVGQTVTAKVIGIQAGESGRPKISLSIKQAAGNPWDAAPKTFQSGDIVSGTVTRCAAFGAFVEIAPGVEGLVHISEMSYVKRVHRPEDVVAAGDRVDVMIKEVDVAKKRISLSLRDAAGDPWHDVKEKYAVGTVVSGIIEKKETYGLFVKLEPGITGLFPKSKIAQAADAAAIDNAKPGDRLSAVVIDINPRDRKLTLGPAETTDSEDWRPYATKSNSDSLGDLGAKLQRALDKKK